MTYWGLPVIGCDVHIRKSVQEARAQHGMRRLSSDVSWRSAADSKTCPLWCTFRRWNKHRPMSAPGHFRPTSSSSTTGSCLLRSESAYWPAQRNCATGQSATLAPWSKTNTARRRLQELWCHPIV